MEMESSRRPLDRSREPGLKKPRLSDESERNPIQNRPFPAAPRPISSNPLVSRLRESESGDSGRSIGGGGGGYQPQPISSVAQLQNQELVSQYRAALSELTFNSKPIITNLTIIAGENVHAAKAIAATVCANIIEVPSEQKLPSLYLLDSIVKNIGRDYIKQFAARLPEVFCKAYRQVDPPIHQNMRHLFGTWKGVFPPQTLQMIEKELGFGSAPNGPSTGPTTSRLDSQSNRPSIHVNPKYLERRLQQPTREKVLSNDISGSTLNSLEDAEITERVSSIGSNRSWVDPSARMHNIQRSQRGTEGIHGKTVSAEYGDYDFGSDFSRNSGPGIERGGARIADQGREKPWYGDRSSLAESISSQRNSFNNKHGFPNYPAPKSTNANSHLQSAKNISSRSSGSILSDSWKNSDEEEFRWSEMNSRLTDHGASDISNNFRKDRSASVDSDKSGLEEHIHRPPSIHDYAPRINKEVSSEQKDIAGIGHLISRPWLSQESHSVDGSFDFTNNGTSGSNEAPTQQRLQSQKSGLSTIRQRAPSPTLTSRYPHLQLQNLTEQDCSKRQSPSHPDHKKSQLPGQLNPYSHDNVPVTPSHSWPDKSQANDFRDSSSIPGVPQRHSYDLSAESEPSNQIQKLIPPQISTPGSLRPLDSYGLERPNARDANAFGDRTPSSLLDAVMRSGILSNSSITPSAPLKSTNLRSAVGQSSNDRQSAPVKISQKKDGASDIASKDVKNAPDPISNLLSSLVAKGLISASKKESPAPTAPVVVDSVESIKKSPKVTKTRDDDPSVSEPSPQIIPASVPEANKLEIKNLIGFDFKPDVIREFHSTVVAHLFDGFEHCCDICGLRLKLQERLNRHLEWHDMKKTEGSGPIKASRKWYASSCDWISGRSGDTSESIDLLDECENSALKDEPMVVADENQCVCVLCGEIFVDFYCQERDEWMFRGAKHMMVPSGSGEMGSNDEESLISGPIVHANCLSESSLQDLGFTVSNKTEKDVVTV